MTDSDCMTSKYSDAEIIVKHYNTGAWVTVDTTTHEITGEYRGNKRQVSDDLRAYAIAQSATFKSETRVPVPIKRTALKSACAVRSVRCLNCDITTHILMGRGYCTDCYGECN